MLICMGNVILMSIFSEKEKLLVNVVFSNYSKKLTSYHSIKINCSLTSILDEVVFKEVKHKIATRVTVSRQGLK